MKEARFRGKRVIGPRRDDLADELAAFANGTSRARSIGRYGRPCTFVVRNRRVAAHKDPARTDVPQFSERAVFDAAVNALVHRDYAVSGSRIRLFMFDDRRELYSSGGLCNSMTTEAALRIRSAPAPRCGFGRWWGRRACSTTATPVDVAMAVR